jgi:hypothetical protein
MIHGAINVIVTAFINILAWDKNNNNKIPVDQLQAMEYSTLLMRLKGHCIISFHNQEMLQYDSYNVDMSLTWEMSFTKRVWSQKR